MAKLGREADLRRQMSRNPRPEPAAQREPSDLTFYWSVFRERFWLIMAVSAIATVSTFIVAKFVLPKHYRAIALIRPEAEETSVGRLLGVFGNVMSPSSFLSGFGPQSDRAEEYVAILKSYDFTTALIHRHQLEAHIDGEMQSFFDGRSTSWRRYKFFQLDLACEYDRLSGNMTLYFIDEDRAYANAVLGYVVDDLRDRVRKDVVRSSHEVLSSLEEKAKRTSDTLLRDEIYELISKQIERQEFAEAEADFAFKVIEPPIVPERPYSPRPVLDAVVVGLFTILLAWVAAVVSASRAAEREARKPSSPGADASEGAAPETIAADGVR